MSAPQIPSAGNNPDPNPGPNPGTGTSTGTDTTSQGSRWRGYSINPPRHWEQSKKRLCDCANHDQDEWPHDFAELIIAPCAYRCPFCNEFNKAQRTRLMASNLRRHITRTHIEGNPDVYGTLVVAPGWMNDKNDRFAPQGRGYGSGRIIQGMTKWREDRPDWDNFRYDVTHFKLSLPAGSTS